MLRGRTISLPTRIAAIRAEPERARRRALLASLAEDSRRDQEPFATFVRDQLGARVLAQHWVLNACTIEIPRARLADASRHTSVVRLWPNEERSPSSLAGRDVSRAALPIGTSGSADNHNIIEAHNLLPPPRRRGDLRAVRHGRGPRPDLPPHTLDSRSGMPPRRTWCRCRSATQVPRGWHPHGRRPPATWCWPCSACRTGCWRLECRR